jgi:hypothetical protein
MAMMNFDQELFFINTYNWLSEEKSFKEIFNQVFIPLLEELGFVANRYITLSRAFY